MILTSSMPLTTEELEQIRAVVRSEIALSRTGRWNGLMLGGGILLALFLSVLAIHVIVIGGFTIYHLMAAQNS